MPSVSGLCMRNSLMLACHFLVDSHFRDASCCRGGWTVPHNPASRGLSEAQLKPNLPKCLVQHSCTKYLYPIHTMLSLATHRSACSSHVVKQSLCCHECTHNELDVSLVYPILQLVNARLSRRLSHSLWRTPSWWVLRNDDHGTIHDACFCLTDRRTRQTW